MLARGLGPVGYYRIIMTTITMMKPTIMVVHMITWSGAVHASLGRLLGLVMSESSAALVPARRRSASDRCCDKIRAACGDPHGG